MEGLTRLTLSKAENNTDGFVYAASFTRDPPFSEGGYSLPLEPQVLPSLSVAERSLLFHFANEATRVTCCNSNIQTELCQLVIPMAAEVPSLMYATLAWSAIHSMAFGRHVDTVHDLPYLIATLKTKSIEHLRREIQNPDEGKIDALLATVRTLCQSEIHLGSDGDSAWRVHVKGAKALMEAIKRSNSSICSRSRLLCRWYTTIESLAALTPSIQAPAQKPPLDEVPESVYLDDYNGYSTDLSYLLGKIGLIAELNSRSRTQVTGEALEAQADEFEKAVYHIMERDNNQIPVFYPGVAEKLSRRDIVDYSLCNQAYQYTALIHIQRRLRKLAPTTPVVQQSVKQIIKISQAITMDYGLSPAIVLTTPVFTAGCEALGEDRTAIRELLSRLHNKLRIRNIKLALDVLEDHWVDEKHDGDWRNLLRWSYFFKGLTLLTS